MDYIRSQDQISKTVLSLACDIIADFFEFYRALPEPYANALLLN